MRDAKIILEMHFDKIVHDLIEGLMSDGGEHKQYHLEVALRLLCGDAWTDEAKSERKWDSGTQSRHINRSKR